MTKTALQVQDFNFYGDNLIALKDNATGEVYTAINFILKGIGFNDDQVRKRRDRWINDTSVSKGVTIYDIPHNSGGIQKTHCINIRKLPLALAKLNITPKMKREQPELSLKLEVYQDKCADILATVFIDGKTPDSLQLQPMVDAITNLTNAVATMQQDISTLKAQQIPKKKFTHWSTKMFPKYQLLMDYFSITRKDLYHNLYVELGNTYPDLDLNQIQEDYCFENGLESCFTLDVIEHNKELRNMFELLVDSILEKYNLKHEPELIKRKTIFD